MYIAILPTTALQLSTDVYKRQGELVELTRHSDKILSSTPFLIIEVVMGAAILTLLKTIKKYAWKRV